MGRRDILALLGFLLLTVVATWPVVINMSGVVFGYPGDTFDHIWMNWWHEYAGDSNLDWRGCPLIDAPVGKDFSQLAIQPTWRWTGLALTTVGGEVFAFNFLLLASFFLSGATMYFLVRHFGTSRMAAFIAGVAFMLCPYHVWHSCQHLTLAAIQWMPLYVLALLRLRERPTLLRAVMCGAAFALVMLENFWYGGFMVLVTLLFLIVSVAWKLKERERPALREILCGLVALLVGIGIVLPWVLPIARRSVEGKEPLWPAMPVYRRSAGDVAALAASPLDYVRPASNHPAWGGALPAPQFVHEKTIYVGGGVLLLAAAGFVAWLSGDSRKSFVALFFGVLCATAFALSLEHLARPAHAIVPIFRAYARLGVLTVMSLCVLAGLGCNAIAKKTRWAFVLLPVLALVLLDFAYVPSKHVTDVSKVPEVYRWLAGQDGDFIVTEIPTSRFTNYDRFFQRIHGKRLLSNDRLDQAADLKEHFDIEEARALFGDSFADRKGSALFRRYVRRLAGYGVKYVIVHTHDPFPPNPVLQSFVSKGSDMTFLWTPEQIAHWSPGLLEEVRRFDDAIVYRVVAPPVKILIAAPDGRTLIIGGREVAPHAGQIVFDILLWPGSEKKVEAEIILESNALLKGAGVSKEGLRYRLIAPLEDIETLVPVVVAGGAGDSPVPFRIRIAGFTVRPK